MKRFWFAVLVCLMGVGTAFGQKKGELVQYTILVHVVGSYKATQSQRIDVVIDGQSLEMVGGNDKDMLALGDYPARLVTDKDPDVRKQKPYDIYWEYELVMPDKTTRTYWVTGMWTTQPSPSQQ